MSRRPDNHEKLSETLALSEYKTGARDTIGFWLYDTTRGMNLAMGAESERAAFIKALHYYQKRLREVEQDYSTLQTRVDAFVYQFKEE